MADDDGMVSSDWFDLGTDQEDNTIYFRRENLYNMRWDSQGLTLDECIAAAAPFGGPIAMTRDPTKIFASTGSDGGTSRPEIYVYAASGVKISSFSYTGSAILKMGWSSQEELVIVSMDGMVSVLDVHGNGIRQTVIDCTDNAVLTIATIYGSGVVAIAENFEVWVIADLEEPMPECWGTMGATEMEGVPHAITVIPPELSAADELEILVSPVNISEEGTIIRFKPPSDSRSKDGGFRMEDLELGTDIIKQVVVSPDGLLVATFNDAGMMVVNHPDFQGPCLCKFDAAPAKSDDSAIIPPSQMAWCGKDSVVMAWCPDDTDQPESLVLVVGPSGDFSPFRVNGNCLLVTEVDGIRIITGESSEFMQTVPKPISDIFSIGSTQPSAMLYDAWGDYTKMKASSVKHVRSIGKSLKAAVQGCVEAAGHEFNTQRQKSLLRAAGYGKCFCESFDADVFVDMCKKVRVLNSLRRPEVGIPLTVVQYDALTPEALVHRLVQRHQHYLAYEICGYLNITKGLSQVLVHWACARVTGPDSDNVIKDATVSKLSKCRGISYAQVATTAFKNNKKQLAITLLDHEQKASEQVPLLLSMKEDEKALEKAIASGDSDLVYMVVLAMKSKMEDRALFEVMATHKEAEALVVAYCREQDPAFLEAYLNARQQDAGHICVRQYFKTRDVKTKVDLLQKAKGNFTSKGRTVDAAATKDQISLLKMQEEIEKATGKPNFLGLSLAETMQTLIRIVPKKEDANKHIKKLAKEFNVPPKRLCWIKLKAYAENRDWKAVDDLARDKPPIGIRPFVEAFRKGGQMEYAETWGRKVDDQ